jgi:hypothetical protein
MDKALAPILFWIFILVAVFFINYVIARTKAGSGPLEIIEGAVSGISSETNMTGISRTGTVSREKIQNVRVGNKPVQFLSGFEDIVAAPGDDVVVVVSKGSNSWRGYALRNRTTGFGCSYPAGRLYGVGVAMGILIFFLNFLVIGMAFWWFPISMIMLGRRADKAMALLPR